MMSVGEPRQAALPAGEVANKLCPTIERRASLGLDITVLLRDIHSSQDGFLLLEPCLRAHSWALGGDPPCALQQQS